MLKSETHKNHDMASDEEHSSGDGDFFNERNILCFFTLKGYFLTEDYRKEVLDNYYKCTYFLLPMAALHHYKKTSKTSESETKHDPRGYKREARKMLWQVMLRLAADTMSNTVSA